MLHLISAFYLLISITWFYSLTRQSREHVQMV
jgi:hypothetical protein